MFLCNWVFCFPAQRIHQLTYCYVHKVAHLLWIFIEVFLRRKKILGCWKNVYHCYLSGTFWRSCQPCLVSLWGCIYARVHVCACVHWGCFYTLIDVSLAVLVHQPSISVICFLLWFLKEMKRLGEIKLRKSVTALREPREITINKYEWWIPVQWSKQFHQWFN